MRKQIRDDQLLKSDSRNRGCIGLLAILSFLLFIGMLLYNNFSDVIPKNEPINNEAIDVTEDSDLLLDDYSTGDAFEDLSEHIDYRSEKAINTTMSREIVEAEAEAERRIPQESIQDDFKPQNKIFDFAEVSPEYPGGLIALLNEINANYDIPKQLQRSGQEGLLVARFVVEKDGSVSDVKILRGVEECDECSTEAIKVLKSLDHKFSPAMQDGEPVRIWFTLPIRLSVK